MMTYAEKSIDVGRDDNHMIYEEQNISQYEDGSVLDCVQMAAYTAQQVIAGQVFTPRISYSQKYVKDLNRDVFRNAKKAAATAALPQQAGAPHRPQPASGVAGERTEEGNNMQCAFEVPVYDAEGEYIGSRPCPKPSTLKFSYAGENEGSYCFCCDGHRNCAEAGVDVASVDPLRS